MNDQPIDVSGAGLEAMEASARLEVWVHASDVLALIAEVRRLRGMMEARAKGDSQHLPCSQCGARVEHVGMGCHTCHEFRRWDTTSDQPKEPT